MSASAAGRGAHVLYLVAPGYPVEVFRSQCPEGWTMDNLSERHTVDEVHDKLAAADFVIQSSAAKLELADLDHAPNLRVVARQGVGVDHLDIDGFARRGVQVTICPAGTTEPVAEHTMMLLLAAGRHLKQISDDVRGGAKWPSTTAALA